MAYFGGRSFPAVHVRLYLSAYALPCISCKLLHIFKCTKESFAMEANTMNPDRAATKGAV